MSEPTAPAVDLQYAPRPKLWRRRRFRLALLVLLGAAAVAGWWWRADVASSVATAKMLYAQRQCMTFEPPAGQVAYDEDVARAQALLTRPQYVPGTLPDGKSIAALWWPKEVRGFPEADRFFVGSPNKGLLFLHERTTSGGRRVLVTGMAWPKNGVLGDVALGFRAVSPATWKTTPQTAGGLWAAQPELNRFHGGRGLRILAGRPDPTDPSHFTVEYQTGRGRGTWDIRVRDNPAAAQGDNPVVLEIMGRPGNQVD